MKIFNEITEKAINLAIIGNIAPFHAWDFIIHEEYGNLINEAMLEAEKKKFLDLCENGKIKGIPRRKYTLIVKETST